VPSTYRVNLTASEADAAAFAALLTEVLDPPPAVSISESEVSWLLEAYFVERPDLGMLSHLLRETSSSAGVENALQLFEIAEENWVARVQRRLHPVKAGRFLIHGSHDRETARGKRLAIEIEAGQAFGTAHHGTTRGCLLVIDRLAKRRALRSVLDVGTGSGVLAIAAAKASNARVLASDIDTIAVGVARSNFRRNRVAPRAAAVLSAGVMHPAIQQEARFDLITANILAGPLVRLAPSLGRLCTRGGHIVLSGLLDSQAREVGATYLRLGLAMETRLSLEGWTTLVLRRK